MTKSDFVNKIYTAAKAAGLSDAAARVMASQGALESGWGQSAPGNNLFGVKAGKGWTRDTQELTTTEGSGKSAVKIKDTFRKYPTVDAAIADRVEFMKTHFPAFNSAPDVGSALDALQNGTYGKYYTGSRVDYESAINSINTNYLGGTPVPPADIPSVESDLSTSTGVSRAQEALKRAGFDPGPIDGDKGPQTTSAIKSFQKANGLTPDGIIGPRTSAKLQEVSGAATGTF